MSSNPHKHTHAPNRLHYWKEWCRERKKIEYYTLNECSCSCSDLVWLHANSMHLHSTASYNNTFYIFVWMRMFGVRWTVNGEHWFAGMFPSNIYLPWANIWVSVQISLNLLFFVHCSITHLLALHICACMFGCLCNCRQKFYSDFFPSFMSDEHKSRQKVWPEQFLYHIFSFLFFIFNGKFGCSSFFASFRLLHTYTTKVAKWKRFRYR